MTNKKEKTILTPPSPKKQEREMAEFTQFIVEQIEKRFLNIVIGGLNKSTINKFADEQVGNYSVVYEQLTKKAKKKINKQFSEKRIKREVFRILRGAENNNETINVKTAEQVLGVNAAEAIKKQALTPSFNALMNESALWVERLKSDTLNQITANTLRAMAQGSSIEDVIKSIKLDSSKKTTNAKLLARNQVANYNSLSNKIRQQDLGVTTGIWSTSKDERVRPCHAARDGKEFELSRGLYSSCDGKTLLPAEDYNCRCTWRAVIPEDL